MDFFQHDQFPARPDHPDFWKLSEIILQLDGRIEATPEGERDEVFVAAVKALGDDKSLYYFAMQRAMRVLGVETVADLKRNVMTLTAMTTLYLEGMIVGATFKERS